MASISSFLDKGLSGVDALADIFINRESQNGQSFLSSVMRGGVPKEKKVMPVYNPLLQMLHAANRDPSNRNDVATRSPEHFQNLQDRAQASGVDASMFGPDENNQLEEYFRTQDQYFPKGLPGSPLGLDPNTFREAARNERVIEQPRNHFQQVLGVQDVHAAGPEAPQPSALPTFQPQWPGNVHEAISQGHLPPNYNPQDPATYPQEGFMGFMHKYAPAFENNTVEYARTMASKLGIDSNNVSRDKMLDPKTLDKWVNEMAIYEGYYADPKGGVVPLPRRLNNPGNLVYANQIGSIGKDKQSGMAIFPSKQAGFAALKRQLIADANRFFK